MSSGYVCPKEGAVMVLPCCTACVPEQRYPVMRAMDRARAAVADNDGGWETTAAVLAYEVTRLRAAMESTAMEWRDAMRITPLPGQPARVLASDVAADRLIYLIDGGV